MWTHSLPQEKSNALHLYCHLQHMPHNEMPSSVLYPLKSLPSCIMHRLETRFLVHRPLKTSYLNHDILHWCWHQAHDLAFKNLVFNPLTIFQPQHSISAPPPKKVKSNAKSNWLICQGPQSFNYSIFAQKSNCNVSPKTQSQLNCKP